MSRRLVRGTTVLAALLLAGGCARSGVRSFDSFEGAADKGVSCAELFEMRAKLKKTVDQEKADALLKRIGCTSATATRTDR